MYMRDPEAKGSYFLDRGLLSSRHFIYYQVDLALASTNTGGDPAL